ncbi:hypothetical protein HCN44_001334, partial [Aphidius gifuensis]
LTRVQAAEETQVDTHEGSTVLLQCRFPPVHENATCFWLTHTNNVHDNAAIDDKSLSPNYRVDMNLIEGRYDLEIRDVSYERNNGKYECRVKVSGSGVNLYHKNVTLTVLRPPGVPTITPSSPSATEGKRMELQCNTYGGSPEPEIKWYRENSYKILHNGPILSIEPTKNDSAKLTCIVRNRAMSAGQTLNATTKLNVNYFPRVSVGPENPLKVKVGDKATIQCMVDAKPIANRVKWTRDGSFIATSFNHTIPHVTLQDAGKYRCEADNNIGRAGESSLQLDVLYPPTVIIEGDKVRVAEVEDTINVHCNVTANPLPTVIEWIREGRPEFRENGPLLRLTRVTSDHAGKYTCRAVNSIHPSGSEVRTHQGEATVTILVRHKPGAAKITPDSPVAIDGTKVILACMANPSGYPEPQYKWWKEGDDGPIPLETSGERFVIDSVHLGSDGTYKCHAINEIGTGETASVRLIVHQAPKILTKLQPQVTRKVGESSFMVSCIAQGKPMPEYNTITGHGNVITVNSTLSFLGHARPQTDKIIANDRGKYTCVFSNEVKKIESQMMLKVEHPPIILHSHSKLHVKVQAWPKPEFQWSLGDNAVHLQGSSSDGHYEIGTTSENDDIYTSILRISNIKNLIMVNIIVVLQMHKVIFTRKPSDLEVIEKGPTYVTLSWKDGFDGGVKITKYYVSYRRIANSDEQISPDCAPPRTPANEWVEFNECHQSNPCNITNLEQLQTYEFKYFFLILTLVFCRCQKKNAAKAKDYEMDSNAVRPSLVTGNGQQNQAPPPYSENKAMEHSMDHALAMEDAKTPAYAQTGYGYHHQAPHNINGVNMGYLDNSYSNSNNGGSVNSQDSIWQMKQAPPNGVNPQYDLGGYVPESDYPAHQHYLPQREDYRESHNLSRQQFCPEPFATVVKSQNPIDSQYDVSGLPYREAYDEDVKPPQQVSLSYDESLESGYSTPNNRRPRIIREIIV